MISDLSLLFCDREESEREKEKKLLEVHPMSLNVHKFFFYTHHLFVLILKGWKNWKLGFLWVIGTTVDWCDVCQPLMPMIGGVQIGTN